MSEQSPESLSEQIAAFTCGGCDLRCLPEDQLQVDSRPGMEAPGAIKEQLPRIITIAAQQRVALHGTAS